jgi:hypothetical protein
VERSGAVIAVDAVALDCGAAPGGAPCVSNVFLICCQYVANVLLMCCQCVADVLLLLPLSKTAMPRLAVCC